MSLIAAATGKNGPAVFLSYTRRQPDEDWATRVVAVMGHRYAVDVWVDKRGIRTGRDFREEIEVAIRKADALVFLGSSASVASPECQYECVYAMGQGKPLVPLFFEDVGWGDFPESFRRLHYQQLQRAENDEQFAALIGKGLLDAALPIDPSLIPKWECEFDRWAEQVHPPYGQVRQADAAALRGFVDECSRKLALNPKHGYHNLNLALLFLKLHENRRAASYAEAALRDLPGRADAHYFAALIAVAAEPLATMPMRRIEQILQLLDNSIRLGHADTVNQRLVESALPWLLKAAIARDYFGRNGLISRAGEPETLLETARSRHCKGEEVDRLLDSLIGLSDWCKREIGSFKQRAGPEGLKDTRSAST
jgi:hypothetical protein